MVMSILQLLGVFLHRREILCVRGGGLTYLNVSEKLTKFTSKYLNEALNLYHIDTAS